MSIDVSEVAFHEAGHAIVAADQGFRLLRVSIARNESENRWDGQTERPNGTYQVWGTENGKMFFDPDGPLKEIAIACAGFLAQAKHHACVAANNVRFSDQIDFNSLLEWMKHPDPQSQNSFELPFIAIESGNPVQVPVQPRWFGGMDRGAFLGKLKQLQPLGKGLENCVIGQLRYVIGALDQDVSWRTVTGIANTLIERCDTKASLTEEEVAELIKRNKV
jgi:hypothetical protein